MTMDASTSRRSFEEARENAERPMWRLLRQHVRPWAPYLFVGIVCGFVFGFVGMAPKYIIGMAFDGLFDPSIPYQLPLVQPLIPETPFGQLSFTVGLLVLIALIQMATKVAREWAMRSFSLGFQHDMRVGAYDRVQRLETAFFEDHETGEIMSILNDDINQLEGFYTSELEQIRGVLTNFLGLVIFLSLINWQLMLVTFAILPMFVLANYWFANVMERIYDEVRSSIAALNARLEHNVNGIATIKSYVREPYEAARVEEASAEYFERQWDGIRVSSWFQPSMQLLTGTAVIITFLVGGSWLLFGPPLFFTEPLTVGGFIAFMLYSEGLRWPMSHITRLIASYKTALASGKRVIGIQEASMTMPEANDPVEVEGVGGSIAYDSVRFTYPRRSEPAIEDLSFEAGPGDTIGIVGPTGAGKSTLVKLLLRFYDVDEGAIRIDGTDIRDMELRSLRRAIGYISQEPFLFAGTIRENIAYGAPAADDRAVREGAEIAGAHEFIRDLPDGYETEVGERGVKLSGGQRQRVALARAFVTDPPILVLDEATSHVDNETEAKIQQGVDTLIADRTAVVIAHRLSTVRDADQLLVIDRGRLREQGTHEELLEAEGLYANLWSLQIGALDELSQEFMDRITDIDLGELE